MVVQVGVLGFCDCGFEASWFRGLGFRVWVCLGLKVSRVRSLGKGQT